MSHDFYKILHIVGLLLLFLGMGGTLLGVRSDSHRVPQGPVILHGLGLLIMLVAGFGMMARLEIEWPWPTWLLAKIAVWLLIGALPVLVRRKVLPRGVAWLLAVVLGGVAAWLAITKPF